MKFLKIFNVFLILFFVISCDNNKKVKINYKKTKIINKYSDSIITYITYDSHVIVKNIKKEKILYDKKIENSSYWSAPIIGKEKKLYYPKSDSVFSCVDYKSKEVIWNFISNKKIENYKLANNILLLSLRNKGIIALDINNGHKLYEIEGVSENCYELTFKDFVFDDDYLFISDFQCNTVSAYDLKGGNEVWNYKSEMNGISRTLIYKKYIFCGITGNPTSRKGKIIVLDSKTGTVLFEKDTPFDLITKPVNYKDKVLYYTYNSKLNIFDFEKMETQIIYEFKENEFSCGYQLFTVDDYIYFNDCNFNLNRFDLNTYDINLLGSSQEVLDGVSKLDNKIKLIVVK